MKKILVTRRLLRQNEERIIKLWDANLNSNDEVYSSKKLIDLSKDCDAILSSIVDLIDENLINKLSDKVKIISNFAVGFGNIDIEAARKKNIISTTKISSNLMVPYSIIKKYFINKKHYYKNMIQ